MLSGILIQQNKYGRSIFLVIYYLLNGDERAIGMIKMITLAIFAASYIAIILKLFFDPKASKITFRGTIQIYQVFLLLFTFVLITNFNPWYVIWLFPTAFWLKSKQIRYIAYLSIGAINSYAITYASKIDNETVGIPYLMIMLFSIAILEVGREISKKLKIEKKSRS